jgi:mannitol-1-phosphate 5-dehydrogenase
VEEFNRIFVSRVRLPGFRRGIEVFEEKEDLLPFEEAKLYGHNAVHSLLGYLAALKGYRTMSEIGQDRALLGLGREAFLEESGAALARKHGGIGDTLFTVEGWRAYAEDLLERIVNPWLHDEVERICRDPLRKLGYGDRLLGAMREALRQGIEPRRLALGAAAALRYAAGRGLLPGGGGAGEGAGAIPDLLAGIWREEPADEWRERCIRLVAEAVERLQ